MSRLTLSDEDKQVRDWFVQTTKSLGCNVQVDGMGMFTLHYSNTRTYAKITPGNIFAIRAGKRDGPATFAGSHLDTQVKISITQLRFGDSLFVAYWRTL